MRNSHTSAGKGKAKKTQDVTKITECAPRKGIASIRLWIGEEEEELNNQPSAPSAEVGPLVMARMPPSPNLRSLTGGKCARNISKHTEVEKAAVA